MTLTSDLTVRFSSQVVRSQNLVTQDLLLRYRNSPIRTPHRFLPSMERIEWNRKNRFKE
jgi:hypothetical protein